jgi:hypothetical protein
LELEALLTLGRGVPFLLKISGMKNAKNPDEQRSKPDKLNVR